MPVCDLHCDLLSYLIESPSHHHNSSECPCNLPFLKDGGVRTQVTALFTNGANTFQHTIDQALALKKLRMNPECEGIEWVPAIENASCLLEESAPLSLLETRLKFLIESIGTPLYVSLTWKGENRFGGGNEMRVGLKPDGKYLLGLLSKYGIAVDFSHTCDHLAHDIINQIERTSLKVRVMASHSNFRAIHNHQRNLPTDVAMYILKNNGLIGLNLIKPFVGESALAFFRHVDYGLRIGGGAQIAFGADYFAPSPIFSDMDEQTFFFDELPNSASYPKLLPICLQKYGQELTEGLFYKNVNQFTTKKEQTKIR